MIKDTLNKDETPQNFMYNIVILKSTNIHLRKYTFSFFDE